MKKNELLRIIVIKYTKMKRSIIVLLIVPGFLFSTRAQETIKSSKDDWKSNWYIRAEVESNDNIYKLSPSQKTRMNMNHPGDSVSGRFKDMNSISDAILLIRPRYRVKIKNGLFNRSLSVSGIINYQYYFQNSKRRNINLGLLVNQKISKSGIIIFQTGYTPSYFVKNYLLDAIDSTGSVSSSERIYHEAVYSQFDFIMSYKYHLNNWIVDFASGLYFGYLNRNYNDEFPGRNQERLMGGLGLEIIPTYWCILNFEYYYEHVQSPVTNEILLLDEPDYQIDFNNDRDFADNNVRTETTVDRSRNVQHLELGLSLIPFERIIIHGGFKFSFKNYTSQEPLDPNYKDRNDKKTKMKLGLDYIVSKNLFLLVKYQIITQKTNRPTDPESVGEITDYESNIIKAGIQWKF